MRGSVTGNVDVSHGGKMPRVNTHTDIQIAPSPQSIGYGHADDETVALIPVMERKP